MLPTLRTFDGILGYDYVECDDYCKSLGPEEWDRWHQWYHGQTGLLATDGTFVVYAMDWDRFVRRLEPFD